MTTKPMNIIRLEGTWKLHCPRRHLTLDAELPGDTHSALLKAGHLRDPYYGLQELEAQWVGRENWTYQRSFKASRDFLKAPGVFLNLENVDTLATVFINGKAAGKTANAFQRHRWEVRHLLKTGLNEIRIEFQSAEIMAAREASLLPYPIPHSQFPIQSQHRNLIRKPQCHAGWDWGPCLMVSGIYGDIYLAATSSPRIEHVLVTQKHDKGTVDLEITCEIQASGSGKSTYAFSFAGQKTNGLFSYTAGSNHLKATLHVKNPSLWWPNGYGDQPLEDLRVSVGHESVVKRIGLRHLETRFQEDAQGLSLEFRVNGVPIFAKGANWIPADALPARVNRDVLEDLLESAAKAHMNMLRVWGGGRYESDDFYDLCDEKGLLVWQDFMFSCSLYPATETFLSNVRSEAEYQIKRLQHRTCLALWCGNNENVGALNWYEESKKNRDRYLVDYDRLNEGVLGNTVRKLDPTRTFWPSSPCGGPGDYSDCWHDDSRGDMHFWSVWHESKPFEDYLKIQPRFCSEFGYQSFPSLESIKTYAPREQWNVGSPIMEHHQKNPGGNARITENMTRYFRFPDGFDAFVYLSQFQQGIAIKTAVEHFRRLRPVCMGALYWQLNEMWPVCSWGSLNYGGKWKLLHYMAKKFFAPVLVSIEQKNDGILEVWGSSDLMKTVSGTLSIEVMDFSGKTRKRLQFRTTLPGLRSKCLKRLKTADLASDPASVFVHVEFKTPGTTSRNTHFMTLYKKCELLKPTIKVSVSRIGKDGVLELTLATNRPAFGVSLNAVGIRGEFDDNVLTLLPGKNHPLKFFPKQRTNREQFQRSLTIHNLRDSYA
ncbi:MAG: glycoside hydrolase family 2 protein [Candidatus Methylacidiphilales bacterium]|nr:glycoside hydrolase family 2 protein [Candidatus Methylacidiphilales bacterium]